MQEIDGYERNVLEAAYALLGQAAARVGDLRERLAGKGYTRASLTDARLEELLASLPESFAASGSGHWAALERATDNHNRVGIPIRRAPLEQRPPFVYVSGGGAVYHSTADCDSLWEGKEKARSEGKTLREIVELSIPAALSQVDRGCSRCTRGSASAHTF